MFKKLLCLLFLLASCSLWAHQQSPVLANESYSRSKRLLLKEVYKDNKKTIYCQIPFDEAGHLIIPEGFDMSKVADRAHRIEIEHIIPAEKFGLYIKQWWKGDNLCVNKEGQPFKGRCCAEKTSRIFRLMQADMYNLYPTVGSLNAIRGHADFGEFPKYFPSLYKSCLIKVADGKIEIPDEAKGVVARTHLYFQEQYPFFKLTPEDQQLFQKWNLLYPVSSWECLRTYRIEKIQLNENPFVKSQCIQNKLWPTEKEEK